MPDDLGAYCAVIHRTLDEERRRVLESMPWAECELCTEVMACSSVKVDGEMLTLCTNCREDIRP